MAKKFPAYFSCSVEFTLAVLGGKWKVMILSYLRRKPCRYSELRALLPELSEKVLSQRLKEMTSIGLVTQRKASGRGAASVYTLTSKGLSLSKLLRPLSLWGKENADTFDVELGEPTCCLYEHGRASTRGHRAILGRSRRDRCEGDS